METLGVSRMKYLFLLFILLLSGCSISDIEKARQEAVCEGHGGVTEYASITAVTCADGLIIPDVSWRKYSGKLVEEKYREIQHNGTNSNKN